MQFVSYRVGSDVLLGVSDDTGRHAWNLAELGVDPGRGAVSLAADPHAREQIADALRAADGAGRLELTREQIRPPIARPGKIIGIGLNYRDHAAETGDPIPQTPVVFAKFPTSMTGPYDPIPYPSVSSRVDYEAELGIVVGAQARDIEAGDAAAYIAGYLVVNDVSARDVQNATSQWTLGKSFDGFCPVGPVLVSSDEVDDPHDLDIALWVNDELRQKSNTVNLIFGVYELISRLSRVCTLEPGDLIATGTPGGVGIGFRPERLLAPGDRVRVSIDKLGSLDNVIVSGGPR